MRTIELSDVQTDMVVSALLIASGEYSREFKRLCEKFPDEEKETKIYWHEKSNKFYDLAEDIRRGKKDWATAG